MDNKCIKNSPWMMSRTFGRGHSRDVYSVTLHLEESQKRGFTQASADQDTEEKLRQRNIILFLVKGKKIVMKV